LPKAGSFFIYRIPEPTNNNGALFTLVRRSSILEISGTLAPSLPGERDEYGDFIAMQSALAGC
jgi:hypothetical protein